MPIDFGDGPNNEIVDSLERAEIVFFPDIDAQINTYIGTHNFGGPGIYVISVLDPNRNGGVLNMEESVETPFCIETTLIISPQAGPNNSVQLLNPAKENACLNKFWIHNPGAFDPDGDILTYSLIDCQGFQCDPIPTYVLPDEVSPEPDIFAIDPVTGDVTWDTPQLAGEYNIAILIEEFRMVAGTLVKVGDVIRDMQITVEICDNNPPEIDELPDLCVEAGTSVSFDVQATDPDGEIVLLSSFGGVYTEVENIAFFNNNGGGNGTFNWSPQCEEVRAQPYQVSFKAEDLNSGTVDLVDIENVFITVVAPAVENPLAESEGNEISLTWEQNICTLGMTDSELASGSYKIYRRNGTFGFDPDLCELGVPEYTGYELVGSVEGLDNLSYLDADDLSFGGQYCYMIVTCFPDGAISYASEEFCAEIIKERPVITNASVEISDLVNGEVYVAWSPPSELDFDVFEPPYQYKLYHGENATGPVELLYTSLEFNDINYEDTLFTHVSLDSESIAHHYQVEFLSQGFSVGFSNQASTPFISLTPLDNSIQIDVAVDVPWTNDEMDVYRFNTTTLTFEFIASTFGSTYLDEGLVNGQEYCYKVLTRGSFNSGDSGIVDPIENWSQEACSQPIDLTPPCAPELTIVKDCEEEVNFLSWTNPNETCDVDDVTGYNLYYAETDTSELELFGSTLEGEDFTSLIWNEFGELNSIAGCFAVSALDSIMTGPDGLEYQNESELSEIICIDNCPVYFLPNVFSPNNDMQNDVFGPFPYKFIDSIDCTIYNRWGGEVFKTNDPDINWDGLNKDSGEMSSDGTYYYVITVYSIRLSGIDPIKLQGQIYLGGGTSDFPN